MPPPPTVDRHEIEELYRAFGPLVRRRARSILGDDLEAQDALQEVFVRVIHSMGEFRRQSQPSTWLYRITTNLCLNRIRDSRRRRARLSQVAEARAGTPAASPAPSAESRVALQGILHQLPDELAQIGIYYYVDEMDQAEIAALLGVSRRTIGYRLERFLAEAQKLLGDDAVAATGPLGVPRAGGEPG